MEVALCYEVAGRRQQMLGGNDKDLRKWHSTFALHLFRTRTNASPAPEVFDNDPIAAQQHDIFGGQGHRATPVCSSPNRTPGTSVNFSKPDDRARPHRLNDGAVSANTDHQSVR